MSGGPFTGSTGSTTPLAAGAGAGSTAPVEVQEPETIEITSTDKPWIVIVWNDPVNLMTYVSYVFRSYFGFTRERADELMLRVHEDGRAVVATGIREEIERHVLAMHGYGLWATLERVDA